MPQLGNHFNLFDGPWSGAFDHVNLPALPAAVAMAVAAVACVLAATGDTTTGSGDFGSGSARSLV